MGGGGGVGGFKSIISHDDVIFGHVMLNSPYKIWPYAYGKSGVGKSTVVEEIKRVLTAKGEKCQIVCFIAGISWACAYHGMTTSVHSHAIYWITKRGNSNVFKGGMRPWPPYVGTSETDTLLKMGFQTCIFCSKVPSKCRKCSFRDPNFKIFPGVCPGPPRIVSSLWPPTPSLKPWLRHCAEKC